MTIILMTIAILATIALLLFLFLISSLLGHSAILDFKDSEILDFKERMLACDLEVERAKVEYLQQTIDWAIDKQNLYGKETIADSLMDALRGTNYTTWKYSQLKKVK